LTQSFVIVFLSELFDRTFLMVMLLTGKMSTLWLFLLAVIATNIMNAVSVSIGSLMPLFLPQWVLSLAVILMFTYFGVKMCKKGLKDKKGKGDDDTESSSEDGGG
jgi:Ca2+/H+ antiporter, TMEM165/GDT1 family